MTTFLANDELTSTLPARDPEEPGTDAAITLLQDPSEQSSCDVRSSWSGDDEEDDYRDIYDDDEDDDDEDEDEDEDEDDDDDDDDDEEEEEDPVGNVKEKKKKKKKTRSGMGRRRRRRRSGSPTTSSTTRTTTTMTTTMTMTTTTTSSFQTTTTTTTRTRTTRTMMMKRKTTTIDRSSDLPSWSSRLQVGVSSPGTIIRHRSSEPERTRIALISVEGTGSGPRRCRIDEESRRHWKAECSRERRRPLRSTR